MKLKFYFFSFLLLTCVCFTTTATLPESTTNVVKVFFKKHFLKLFKFLIFYTKELTTENENDLIDYRLFETQQECYNYCVELKRKRIKIMKKKFVKSDLKLCKLHCSWPDYDPPHPIM